MGEALEKERSWDNNPNKHEKSVIGNVIYPDKLHKNRQDKLTPKQVEERIEMAHDTLCSIISALKENGKTELNNLLCDQITKEDLRDEKFDINITTGEFSGLHIKMLPNKKLHIYFTEKIGDSGNFRQQIILGILKSKGWDGEKFNDNLRSRYIIDK